MSLEELTSRYISSAEKVFQKMQKNTPTSITDESANNLLLHAMDYLKDAKYYKAEGKLETSLTSIAYCEGILDALRLLGAVKFEWPTIPRKTEK